MKGNTLVPSEGASQNGGLLFSHLNNLKKVLDYFIKFARKKLDDFMENAIQKFDKLLLLKKLDDFISFFQSLKYYDYTISIFAIRRFLELANRRFHVLPSFIRYIWNYSS